MRKEILIDENMLPLSMVFEINRNLHKNQDYMLSFKVSSEFLKRVSKPVGEWTVHSRVLQDKYEDYALNQMKEAMYDIPEFKELYEIKIVKNEEITEVLDLDNCWLVFCRGKASHHGKKLFQNRDDAVHFCKKVSSEEGVTEEEILFYNCNLKEKRGWYE